MANPMTQAEVMTMTITSPAFQDGGMIPERYSCDGDDISPPLRWEPVPAGTRSLALIVDDPDAPSGTFVHWVLYDLPAGTDELPENMPTDKSLPNGARQGVNDFRKIGYSGPCPPGGTHRYFFKVYALDGKTDLPAGESKARLLKAMQGHILAQGQIVGRYERR
jgi:hypothetical protein